VPKVQLKARKVAGEYQLDQLLLLTKGEVDARYAELHFNSTYPGVYTGDSSKPLGHPDLQTLYQSYAYIEALVDGLMSGQLQFDVVDDNGQPIVATRPPAIGLGRIHFIQLGKEVFQHARDQRRQARSQATAGGSTPPPNNRPISHTNPARPNRPNGGGGATNGNGGTAPSSNTNGNRTRSVKDYQVPNWIVLVLAMLGAVAIWFWLDIYGSTLLQRVECAIITFVLGFVLALIVRWMFEQVFDV
jgi:hypothetical protein